MSSDHKKELRRKLTNAKRASNTAMGDYRELRTEWLLTYGTTDEEKKLGKVYEEQFVKPRKEKREKAKAKRESKKTSSSSGGGGTGKAAPVKKVKKVSKVIKKKPAAEAPVEWECKGSELHGEDCKGTNDANKARAKADTRHEGKMFPTCKACKKFIATKRKEEREAKEAENSPQEEEEAEPMDVEEEDEVNEEEEQE